MTHGEQSPALFSGVTPEEVWVFLRDLREQVSICEPVFDEFGSIVDGRLVWWNCSYQGARRGEVAHGQLISQIANGPSAALSHLAIAWGEGTSLQTINVTMQMNGTYKGIEAIVGDDLWCRWQRIGDVVVTTSPDLEVYREFRALNSNQQSLLAVAAKKRAMAVERERIARSLHDTVIQNLYATSLALSMSLRKARHDEAKAMSAAIDSIADVIAEIRHEIMDIETQRSSPLRLQLEDALMPILHAGEASLDLSIDMPRCDDEVSRHIRAVCTEAASNAVRHGHAKHINIAIVLEGENLTVTVSDDGVGIPPDAVKHNGLHNMRERAESLGGTMEMTTQKNYGTTLTWSVPCSGWCR